MSFTLLASLALGTLMAISGAYLLGRLHGAEEPERRLALLAEDARQQQEYQNEVQRKLRISLSNLQREQLQRNKLINKVVTRPEYQRTCLDDDGLRLANDAILNAASGASDPVSSFASSDCGDSGGSSSQDCRSE